MLRSRLLALALALCAGACGSSDRPQNVLVVLLDIERTIRRSIPVAGKLEGDHGPVGAPRAPHGQPRSKPSAPPRSHAPRPEGAPQRPGGRPGQRPHSGPGHRRGPPPPGRPPQRPAPGRSHGGSGHKPQHGSRPAPAHSSSSHGHHGGGGFGAGV